ncbi:MAG: type IVB secretion system protein IcmF [Gammaproteobacteria bacterium]|nr:type IVB secretion system protein IcmF [Gammaproteobacteria bacterium]
MDESLKQVCIALKSVFSMLKPATKPLAFVLLIGRTHQGKSTLLKYSGLKLYPLKHPAISLLYHDDGVVLEICESWLSQTPCLLSAILKRFNRVHPAVRISGLVLCMDVQGFVDADVDVAKEESIKHVQWLKRFVSALNYPVEVAVFLTKGDVLAGFVPFFQSEYPSEFLKPLGFSIDNQLPLPLALKHYRQQYERLVENLVRQVLPKLQAVRSSAQRTLIREFPLQLASLQASLQGLVELLLKEGIALSGLYWMSADSREHHVDRIHQRIAGDYELGLPVNLSDFRPQPAYFVQGALESVLVYTKQLPLTAARPWRLMLGGMLGLFVLLIGIVSYGSFKTASLLDQTSQELLAYDLLVKSGQKPTAAAYHLTQALRSLQSIPYPMKKSQTVQQLKTLISTHSQQTLQHRFLPQLLQTLEIQMRSSHATQQARYEALKTYLRFVEPNHFSAPLIREWFAHYWQDYPPASPEKARALLDEVLSHPIKGIERNQALITDIRNYLNALPAGYFYYLLAKKQLEASSSPLHFAGVTLSHPELPAIYTKVAFQSTLQQLEQVASQLREENWVLARVDLDELPALLQQAYCFEYVTFWKQLMKQSTLTPMHSFQEGRHLAEELVNEKSISKLIDLVKLHTTPYSSALSQAQLFNEKIASQFTSVHFLSQRALRDLNQSIRELENFLATLSIVHDDGQTAFAFTKARFQGETSSDSLSLLYQRVSALPQPLSEWVKQLSDGVWSMLIQQSRLYLNARWQAQVMSVYTQKIAHRFPFDVAQTEEVKLDDFEAFFAPSGILETFAAEYIKPFIDTSHPQWKAKERDGLMMPVSEDMMSELIRANVISNMFFPQGVAKSQVVFSLEKVTLDPVVFHLLLMVGKTTLEDDQSSHSTIDFHWPATDALLKIDSIEGGHYSLEEQGVWAFFKMLQKVNVLVDADDASTLQILFEINGNAGRYVLKTQNQINPFSPGILDGFILKNALV